MGDSKNTQKEEIQALSFYESLVDKEEFYPKIIERKPQFGDDHPVDKSTIKEILKIIPMKYVYGLKTIELRARNQKFGKPFATYRIRDKSIILYSAPKTWEFDDYGYLSYTMSNYKAQIEFTETKTLVKWTDEFYKSLWWVHNILYHEIGHHFVEQYKMKRKPSDTVNSNEILADLHAKRIRMKIYQKIKNAT